jgi:hypothetical protein
MHLKPDEIDCAAEDYTAGYTMPEDLAARSVTPMDLFWLAHYDRENKTFDRMTLRDRAGVVAAFLESDDCNVFVPAADLLPDGAEDRIVIDIITFTKQRVTALVEMPDGPQFEAELRLVLATPWASQGTVDMNRFIADALVFKGGIDGGILGFCLGYAAWSWWTFRRGRCMVAMRRAAARAAAMPDDALRGEIAQIKRAAVAEI